MSHHVLDSCSQMEIPSEFLDIRNHPTSSDLERNMGKDLLEVYLKTCTPFERTLLGRDKPLKGPGQLWIDPDDRMEGSQVRFTPMRTEKVQALTHLGILEIGKQIEGKMEEKNKKRIAEAIADDEELAKFEAKQRIKFHVETETQKLNAKWQQRMNELKMQHEDEKNCLRKMYEDGRELLREFVMKKCEKEAAELVSKAVAETTVDMEKKRSEEVDKEVAQQTAAFQQQMENTLENLQTNGKDRMDEMKVQCLKAMDLQHHLMMCRQITEIMHVMTIEKQRGREKMIDVKNENESIGVETRGSNKVKEPTWDHQSKSIKQLWIEFFNHLDDVDGETLDGDERRIYDKIHQLHDELMMEQKPTTVVDEILVVHEPIDDADGDFDQKDSTLDWIHRQEDNFELISSAIESSVDIKWKKAESVKVPADDSFTTSVFNRLAQPHHSMHHHSTTITQIASSIMNMLRESKDEKTLQGEIIAMLIQEEMMRKLFSLDPSATAVDMIPVPKTRAVSVKDSFEVTEKRLSVDKKPVESQHLLSVVDSLEVMNISRAESKKPSRAESITISPSASKPSIATPAIDESSISVASLKSVKAMNVSSHTKTPNKAPSKLYAKMSEDDWRDLKKLEQSKSVDKSRQSSVQFDEENLWQSSRRSSRKSSILKRSSDVKNDDNIVQQNALQPIHQKCREALNGMRMESVLKMLCDDED